MRLLALAGALLSLYLVPNQGERDWPLFGYSPSRTNEAPPSGITAANAKSLHRRQIALDGTVDSSAIYLRGVTIRGKRHDAFFVTTTYGKTEAIDAASGAILWRYTPATYRSYAGSARITNMSPAADPSRTAIYAGAPDGRIRKLRVADGRQIWSTSVTRDPTREKLTSSLNVSRGLVVATTGGYIGDAPSYQGHVVTLRPSNGAIVHVWNSLCANRHELIAPSSCGASGSAIWARSGAVVENGNGRLLVATGNAPYDGRANFGDAVIELTPDGSRMLRHFAPPNTAQLNDQDLDLGSTAPALLGSGFFVQGGKDGVLRLVSLRTFRQVQAVSTPGRSALFSAPATWRGSWVFVASLDGGIDAWRLRGRRLSLAWHSGTGGTSPVVSGGVLWIAGGGELRAYLPTSGRPVAALASGDVHWQSPIVVDGRIALATGDANDHLTSGYLNVWSR